MFTRFILPSILFFSCSLSAVPDLSCPLSLPDLVDFALENNPETSQSWWNARRAAAAVGNAKGAYYPKLGFDANAIHGRDFKFINGPDTNYTYLEANLILSMLLYDFGERKANVTSAKMALLAANWNANWTIQRVMVRVLENAYSTFHFQATHQAFLASLKDAEKVLETAQHLNRAGLNPIADVYSSQAVVAQMRMDVTQQRAFLDIQKGKLAASMGLPADTPLCLAPLNELPPPQKQQIAGLIALAQQQRSDLMAKQARLCESFARLDKARTAYAPKLSLFGEGGYDHAINDKANGAHYQVGVNLNFPLFTGFEATYQKQMAYADTKISGEELAQLQLDIALDVLTQSLTLEAAQEMFCYAEDNLNSALKAYEATLDKYKAGKERIAEVSNAQRQLANARVRYSEVKTKWLVSLANLAYATGTLAPYTETPCEQNP